MTDAELIEALARALDRCRTLARAEKVRPHEFVAVRWPALEAIPHVVAEALALLDEPRDPAGDVGEEVLLALQSVQLDWQTAHGLGTLPTISDMSWGRVACALQRLGSPAE